MLAALWIFAANLPIFGADETHGSPQRIPATKSQWREQRAATLRAAQTILGPLPGREKRCALAIHDEEPPVDCGRYIRRFISYEAEPGGRVPAYLLIPKLASRRGAKLPAVLALHQTHALGQKVVVGLGNSPNDQYGVELAERDYVVLAPAYPQLANYQPNLQALGYHSGVMKAIWNNIRGLDLLESLPCVQGGRFAAIGHSLGGHTSIFTAVFDERIKIIVTSCGFDSFRDYMNGNIQGWTSSRYMPRLLDYAQKLEQLPFDFPDLIAALAPRVCFVSAPFGDSNFRWASVDRVLEAARPAYRLFGAETRLLVEHPDCAHSFPPAMREQAYQLMDAELRPIRR